MMLGWDISPSIGEANDKERNHTRWEQYQYKKEENIVKKANVPVPIIHTGPADSESIPRPENIEICRLFTWSSRSWSASHTQVPCGRLNSNRHEQPQDVRDTHLKISSWSWREMQSKEGSIAVIENKIAIRILSDSFGTLRGLKIGPGGWIKAMNIASKKLQCMSPTNLHPA
jgi:hypothetical protein